MCRLTLVHATRARLHGQLLSGSHIRGSKKVTAREIAALQVCDLLSTTAQAREEGLGRRGKGALKR